MVEGSKEAASSVPASLREPGKEHRARRPLASAGLAVQFVERGPFKFDAIFILGAVKPLTDVSGTVVLIGPYVRPFLLAIAATLPACAAPPLPFPVGHFPWREVSGGSGAVGVGSIRRHPLAGSRAGPGSARGPLGAPRRSRGGSGGWGRAPRAALTGAGARPVPGLFGYRDPAAPAAASSPARVRRPEQPWRPAAMA